jgi:hypothetical protein
VTADDAVRLLRLPEARQMRFADPFLLVARLVRGRSCAVRLAGVAVSFGSTDALTWYDRGDYTAGPVEGPDQTTSGECRFQF